MLFTALLAVCRDPTAPDPGFRGSGVRVRFERRGDAAGEQFGWEARDAGDGEGRDGLRGRGSAGEPGVVLSSQARQGAWTPPGAGSGVSGCLGAGSAQDRPPGGR